MFRILLCFVLLLFSFAGISQKYKPSDEGSKVHFVINNFGIATGGDLSGLTGEINFIPANVTTSTFNVSVNVSTIDTDNDSRDGHLRGKGYFDAETYPQITLKSTKIFRTNKSSSGWFQFSGTLTMHGVTKPIAFPFQATKKGDDYLFVGGFTLNRLDYGVGKSSSVMSSTVKVSISALAKKS